MNKVSRDLVEIFRTLLGSAKSILWFGVAFYVIQNLILLPLQAMVLRTFVEQTGASSIVNFDLAAYLFTPVGMLWLVSLLATTLVLLLVQQAGFVLISSIANSGQQSNLLSIFRELIRSLPRYLSNAVFPALLMLAVLGTLGAYLFLVQKLFLSSHDFNFYLQTKPTDFYMAMLAALFGLLLALPITSCIFIAWTLALSPIVLREEWWAVPVIRAWKASRGKRFSILGSISAWAIAATVSLVVLAALLLMAAETLLGWFDHAAGISMFMTGALIVFSDMVIDTLVLFLVAGYSLLSMQIGARVFDGDQKDELQLASQNPIKAQEIGKPVSWLTVMLGAVVICIVAAFAIIETARFGEPPVVVAHRGASAYAPENTLAAIREAIKQESDFVEVDVQKTKDGELVVIHDKDLRRTTGKDGKIADLTDADIKALDAGGWFDGKFAGEPIPTFSEVLETFGGEVGFFVELKTSQEVPGLPLATIKAIAQHGSSNDRNRIISLDYEALQTTKKLSPQSLTGLLVSANIGDMISLDVDFLAVSKSLVSANLLRDARAAGKEVHVWTVNDPDEMEQMIELGVNGIITDRPGLLRSVLNDYQELTDTEKLLKALNRRLRNR